jgi:hypothetical protein
VLSNLEHHFIKFVSNLVGIKNAIITEDLIMLLSSIVLGYIAGQTHLIHMIKKNMYYDHNLQNHVYQINEYNNIVGIAVRIPKNFFQRLELIVGLYAINYTKNKKLGQSTSSKILTIFLLLIIIFSLLVLIAFAFAFNVAIDTKCLP